MGLCRALGTVHIGKTRILALFRDGAMALA